MARWLVADSLSCPEQFFCSHLDSYSHYLREAGEDARSVCLIGDAPGVSYRESDTIATPDVLFVLDRFDRFQSWPADRGPTHGPTKRIAQVAAICNPMPWDVRKPDGSPAYDLVLSSIPWMVEAAKGKGCRAEYMPLCFDHRALVCGMNVKERDIPCLFVGTVDGNHQKRAAILRELGDLVTITPPTFGRAYYELHARAKVTVHVAAEWAKGARNALRIIEGAGMGSFVIADGEFDGAMTEWIGDRAEDTEEFRRQIKHALADDQEREYEAEETQAYVLSNRTYIQMVPRLIELARSL